MVIGTDADFSASSSSFILFYSIYMLHHKEKHGIMYIKLSEHNALI